MFASDDDVLREAQLWAEAGNRFALATVIDTWGSAPRPAGSHLIVHENGRFLGSVSGGCIEAEVITEAIDVIASGSPSPARIWCRR